MTHARPLLALAAAVLVLGGCATPPTAPESVGAARPAARSRATDDRILALNCARVRGDDVKLLAQGPTPQVFLIHGGVYPVHLLMEDFGHFLVGMGYPEDKVRDPGTGDWSYTPYGDARELAGRAAWFYEKDGVRPILVGHSQGGIQVSKLLHELAGTFGDTTHVYDPLKRELLARTTIVDPVTRRERPTRELSVAAAYVVGTGGWALALPVHWNVLTVAKQVPDSVGEFTSYRIGLDLFAWDVPGLEGLKLFEASGKAKVRNIVLPAAYSHVFVPGTESLLADPRARAWIDGYVDDGSSEPKEPVGLNLANIVFAGDVWYGIKKHWCDESQRLIRAQRARPSTAG